MIWYPYEQMKTMKDPYKILDAEGVHLYTKDQKLIDSISSWWCMIHGYKHPELTEAIKEQADRFCHVMLGGLTHEPVEKLSEKLQEFLPGDLDYCFFSDSGSVAVEVSLKMALQYNTNQGRKRPLVLALEHAYHGDTFKAMEVGDDEDYHFAFDKKEGVVHIPTEIPALEEAFEQYHDRLNCFIVEPLLQGAGGMRMYDISFLKRARELCDQYDVLLIFDEVATGFGRTGNRFVADLVLPDILVLGKALTPCTERSSPSFTAIQRVSTGRTSAQKCLWMTRLLPAHGRVWKYAKRPSITIIRFPSRATIFCCREPVRPGFLPVSVAGCAIRIIRTAKMCRFRSPLRVLQRSTAGARNQTAGKIHRMRSCAARAMRAAAGI